MRYFLYQKQNGRGCDYMISCGEHLGELSAKTKADAIAEAIGLSEDWKEEVLAVAGEYADIRDVEGYLSDYVSDTNLHSLSGESARSVMTIYEVSDEIDIIPMLKAKLAEVDEWKFEMLAEIQEEEERRAYEKLHAKFGKKEAK